uniref:Uncharacterized protein n=1 Tax=Cacopsylla melanoneura TaxID=428564 RepID=A0A8D8LE67_9HEMI
MTPYRRLKFGLRRPRDGKNRRRACRQPLAARRGVEEEAAVQGRRAVVLSLRRRPDCLNIPRLMVWEEEERLEEEEERLRWRLRRRIWRRTLSTGSPFCLSTVTRSSRRRSNTAAASTGS